MATPTLAHQAAIANLYIAMFNRAPDADGFAFWTQALANGASIDTLAQSFVQTPEAQAIYPVSQTAAQFVTTYYANVLGRPIDASGLKFWTEILESSGGVNSNFARALVVSKIVDVVNTPLPVKPEELTDSAYALTFADRNTFKNKGEIAIFYAAEYKGTDLNMAKQVLTVVGPASTTIDVAKALLNPPTSGGGTPAPTPTGLNLVGTTGADDFVGSSQNDTFSFVIDKNAPIQTTLQATDKVAGGDGTDTLKITTRGEVLVTDFGTDTLFTGIETVSINVADTSAHYTATSGVSTLIANGGAGALVVDGMAASSTLIVNGGRTASTNATYEAAATNATITLAGTTNASVVVDGAGLTSATVTSKDVNNSVATLQVGSANTFTLNLVAETVVSINSLIVGKVGTVNVSGDGFVGLGTLSSTTVTSIDASANKGGMTAILSNSNNAIVIKGSQGNDVIIAGEAELTGTVDAYTGTADRLIANSSVALSSSALRAKYSGFEILDVRNGVSVDLDGLVGITSVDITDTNGATGVTNLNVTQAGAVTIRSADSSSGVLTIGVANTGASDTVKAAVITDANGGAPAVNLTGLTLTNVEKLELTGNGSTSLNNGRLTLTTHNATLLDSIIVKKAGAVSITVDAAHAATNLSIDISDATGASMIDASAYHAGTGVTIQGGSGNDTISASRITFGVAEVAPQSAVREQQTVTLTGAFTGGEVEFLGFGTFIGGGSGMPLDLVAALIVANKENILENGFAKSIGVVDFGLGDGPRSIKLTYGETIGDKEPLQATVPSSGVVFGESVENLKGALESAGTPSVTQSVDTLTGGAGNDIFKFSTPDNGTAHGGQTAVITDFKTGEDKIDLTVSGPRGPATYLEVLTDAGSLSALLTNADNALNNTVTVYVGRVGTDTYVVSDLDGTGYTDVIKLAGVANVGVLGVAHSDFVVNAPLD